MSGSPEILKGGDTIGGWTIEEPIAEGGMGMIYLAHSADNEQPVAIKVLHHQYVTQPDQVRRFIREALVASSLDHPGIAKVLQVSEEYGRYFMVMEYIPGKNLRQIVIREGPLGPRRALRIAASITEALIHAHERGLVHRDIKPANILMAGGRDPKLVDFGLARLAEDDHEVTRTGQIVGTPAFMSPEQCRGDPVDARTDLYGLGATLYMLLSGELPFRRGDSSPAALVHRVVHDMPTPLHSLVPDIPESVVVFVQRLMAKYPGSRYQTGQEVATVIDELLLGEEESSRVTAQHQIPQKSSSYLELIQVGILALTLGTAVYLVNPFLGPSDASADAEPSSSSTEDGTEVQLYGEGDEEPTEVSESPPPRSLSKELIEERIAHLKTRVTSFIQKLERGKIEDVHSFLASSETQHPEALSSLVDALENASANRLGSPTHQTVLRQRNLAQSIVSFPHPEGKGALMIVLTWRLLKDEWTITHITPGHWSYPMGSPQNGYPSPK